MKKKFLLGCLLFNFFILWSAANPSCFAAEKFPAKPITLLIGYAPGGSADLVARYLADFVQQILGQPVVVLNREGGAGAVALAELKNAPPDGYTIGYLPASGIISAHLRKLPYHPIQDFEPIIHHSDNVFGLVLRADSPFKAPKDLISHAQANPEKVSYCTAGAGSVAHLAMMLLGEAANVKWTHVPFGGGAQAIAAQLGGHVTFGAQTAIFKSYVDAGRLRLLASLMEKRIAGYPDIPTLIELGYNVATPSIQGYVGPKGMPKDRVQILHAAFRKGVESPGFKEVLNKVNMKVDYQNPDDFRNRIKTVYESTSKIIEKYRAELKKQ